MTFWWIILVIAVCAAEALLIFALLIQRSRRARAEDSLRLSEEKFSKAFRSSPDAFIITRQADYSVLEVNDRWEAIVGYTRSEAIGRTAIDLNLYVNWADRTEILKGVNAKGYLRNFETHLRTKSGEIRTVRLSAESITINNEACFLIILRDVTELKKSEAALREKEERNRLVVETAMDAVITADADGRITGWNHQAEVTFGWSVQEAVGQLLTETVIPPKYREAYTRGLQSFHATGAGEIFDRRIETTGRRRDGTEFPVELTISSTHLGEQLMFVGFLRDITVRKQSEQELQQLTGRLIHLQDEERKRIASELHDSLGQSLVIIKNRATIGLRDTTDTERVTEQLEEISSAATAAIDDVHEIAHNLRPYELDRLGLVKALEAMIAKLAKSSSIQFFADPDHIDGLLSPAAETSVYRIVQEGLNNVMKHAGATEARVSLKRLNGRLVVSVSDNGKGIKLAATNDNGGGLGLAGIAERARLLGGALQVKSDGASGTEMTITIKSSESGNGQDV